MSGESFRKNAESCFRMAKEFTDADEQAHWLHMAQYWVDRARDAEGVMQAPLPPPPEPPRAQPAQQQQQPRPKSDKDSLN